MAITDDFNRASLGSGWETVRGTAWVTSGSTVAKPTNEYINPTAIRRTEAAFPNDHYSQVETELSTGDLSRGAVACRIDASGNCYYAVLNSATNVELRKRVAGANSYLNDWIVSNFGTNTLVTLKMAVAGTTIAVSLNGTPLGNTTDSDLTSGKPGLASEDGAAAGFPRFDNFESTDASGGGVLIRSAGSL